MINGFLFSILQTGGWWRRCTNPSQQRPGHAGVLVAHQVEEAGDGAAVADLEVAHDQRLGELVEQHHGEREAQPQPHRGT